MPLVIGPVYESTLVKRPSQVCKTPYVADVMLKGAKETTLAHSPSLGCCGLIDKGTRCKMLMTKLDPDKNKCPHRIQFIQLPDPNNSIVCVNPKTSEDLVELVFINNLFPSELDMFNNTPSLQREVSFEMSSKERSRFDFKGTTSTGENFVLEVKSVPLVNSESISLFPLGYTRRKGDVVSPRALKHIHHLEEMLAWQYVSVLVFCVQRGDSNGFKLSDNDPTYRDAVLQAKEKGVLILVFYFNWIIVDYDAHCDLEKIELY